MMKHSVFSLLATTTAAIAFAACGHNDGRPSDDSLAVDTSLSDTGNLSIDNEPYVEPSRHVDVLFEDFLYTFLTDAKFQAHRIAYPLPRTHNGRKEMVAKGQWTYTPLYANDDSYVLMFDQTNADVSAQDSTSKHVTLEWCDFDAQTSRQFVFDKMDGKWLLTGLVCDSLNHRSDNGFYTFFHRFATDSLFRQQHISNPFAFKTIDTDSYQAIDGVLDAEQWPDFAPDIPAGHLTHIAYGRRHPASHTRTIGITGADTGASCALRFRYQRGKWTLYSMEDV